jgi:membrane protease YdiL (CAAX protease family)
MSDSQNSDPPVSAAVRTPKTWDFMETLFVALVAYAVYGLMTWLAYFALVALNDTTTLTPTVVRKLVNVASIFASGTAIAVLWVATRMAGRDFAEYLALNWPNRNELLLAFAVVAVLVAIEFAVWPYESSVNSPFVAGGAGGLFVLLVSGCLAVPIMEELVFRGFMFRGWSESFLGPIGAIVLTSALFGIYHTQYDWLVRLWIFLTGLALCFFRWRSNSTWLAAVMHSAINIILLFFAGPYV